MKPNQRMPALPGQGTERANLDLNELKIRCVSLGRITTPFWHKLHRVGLIPAVLGSW